MPSRGQLDLDRKSRLPRRIREHLRQPEPLGVPARETVRRLVYETAVFSPDQPPDWTLSFYNVRSGDITDKIAIRRLDEISTPESAQIHQRAEIARKGLAVSRKAASDKGIEILDMTMGVIEPQDFKLGERRQVRQTRVGDLRFA